VAYLLIAVDQKPSNRIWMCRVPHWSAVLNDRIRAYYAAA
jgi:hypothetical protein